jgi:hypothetical protein
MGDISGGLFIASISVLLLCTVAPFLLYLFLRNRHEQQAELDRTQAVKDIGRSCHDFQVELNRLQREAFARVVLALEENSKALNVNNEILRRWRPPDAQHRVPT